MFHKIFQYTLQCLCVVTVQCQNPEVEIPQGKLIGGERTNIDGGTYYAFKSIPFGKPPLGELRFKVSAF